MTILKGGEVDKNLAALQRAREEFLYLAHKPANLELKVGERTLREMVAHFLAWDITTLASVHQALAGLGPTIVTDEATPAFNAKAALLWGDGYLLRDYRQTSALLFKTYQILVKKSLLEGLLVTDPIADDLAHYQEHLAELRRALGL